MDRTRIMINVFGPSTAGKSTVAELLQEHIERLYTVDFDIVKRQISGYQWRRDSTNAMRITYDTLASATGEGLQVLVLLPAPKQQDAYEKVASTAHEKGYRLINTEITAPHEVLIKRYAERLLRVKTSGSKWKFKTPEEFRENLEVGYYRPDDTLTFDSSTMSPDKIFNSIKKVLIQEEA